MVDKRTPHVYVEFEAKFGELWATRTLRETWWTREQFTFMWNLRQNLESSGHQEKYKSHTSVGRKFAPVEGLSHDLVCTGSIYHVHFAWQVWHGQLSPRFKFDKLKSFRGVEIDQNHVDKRILGGKGFAVGRLKRHNFCPASVSYTRMIAPVSPTPSSLSLPYQPCCQASSLVPRRTDTRNVASISYETSSICRWIFKCNS